MNPAPKGGLLVSLLKRSEEPPCQLHRDGRDRPALALIPVLCCMLRWVRSVPSSAVGGWTSGFHYTYMQRKKPQRSNRRPLAAEAARYRHNLRQIQKHQAPGLRQSSRKHKKPSLDHIMQHHRLSLQTSPLLARACSVAFEVIAQCLAPFQCLADGSLAT